MDNKQTYHIFDVSQYFVLAKDGSIGLNRWRD